MRDDGDISAADDDLSPQQAADAAAAEVAESHRKVEQSRVEMMRAYAETTGCRRQFLLAYFGETLEEPCGHCDTCEAGTAQRGRPTPATRRSRCSPRVTHASWGSGVVMRYEGDRIVVLFEEVGYRTLSLEAVAARGLLEAS